MHHKRHVKTAITPNSKVGNIPKSLKLQNGDHASKPCRSAVRIPASYKPSTPLRPRMAEVRWDVGGANQRRPPGRLQPLPLTTFKTIPVGPGKRVRFVGLFYVGLDQWIKPIFQLIANRVIYACPPGWLMVSYRESRMGTSAPGYASRPVAPGVRRAARNHNGSRTYVCKPRAGEIEANIPLP